MFSLRVPSLEGTWSSSIYCNNWSIEFIDSIDSSHIGKEILNSKFFKFCKAVTLDIRDTHFPVPSWWKGLGSKYIKAVHGEFSTGTGLHWPKAPSTEIKSHLLISFLPGSLFQTKMAEQRFLPLAYLGIEVSSVFVCVSLGPCAVIQVLQLSPQECGLS